MTMAAMVDDNVVPIETTTITWPVTPETNTPTRQTWLDILASTPPHVSHMVPSSSTPARLPP